VAKVKRQLATFNSPFELGLRMVYLLYALRPRVADLQKLVLLDYAAIYSGDLNGPPSLHTPVPFRAGEMFTRRELIQQGLYLMSTKGLVHVHLIDDGVAYLAGEAAVQLVGSLQSSYFQELASRCAWAIEEFGNSDSLALTRRFNELGHRWGAEVETTSLQLV
jgi:hypothetical protein